MHEPGGTFCTGLSQSVPERSQRLGTALMAAQLALINLRKQRISRGGLRNRP